MGRLIGAIINFELIARTIRLHGKSLAINGGKSLHCHVINVGINNDTYISNNLITMYANFGFLPHAQKVFDEMPLRNVTSWTALISMYTHNDYAKEALNVFKHMLKDVLMQPNVYTLSIALKACGLCKDLDFGRFIYNYILERGIKFDTILGNTIIDMFVKCGDLNEASNFFNGFKKLANINSYNTIIYGYLKEGYINEAEKLFNCISNPDIISFNSMITGFAQIESKKALDYTSLMHKIGLKLDNFTFPGVLNTCGTFNLEKIGTQIHAYILKFGYESNFHTGSALIDMYSNCSNIKDAMKIYELYINCREIIVEKLPLMNSMLSGFVINGFDKLAINMVTKIHNSGIMPDIFTLSSCLKACINLENTQLGFQEKLGFQKKLGFQVHGFIIKNGYEFDNIIRTCLVDLYAINARIDDAFKLFQGLNCKDCISYTGFISNCINHGSYKFALYLLRQMINLNEIKIDQYIISCIIKACSNISWLKGGIQVHAYTIKLGFHLESIVIGCLIDMYSKCGNVQHALEIFRFSNNKDVIIWTSIITGCAYNGESQKALGLFDKMLKLGVKPNEITLLSVLYACRNAGLVKEACNYFTNMKNKFGLKPKVEHYSCIIDILTRACKFDEVKRLILEMPSEKDQDQNVKKCLVGRALVRNNFDEFFKFDSSKCYSDEVATCVAISNAYASLGMWDISANIRENIRNNRSKEAGISWV